MLDNTTHKPASFNQSTLSGTSFTPSALQALTPGHNYTWYIGAETLSGLSGGKGPIAWSSETFALAALPAPTQIGPLGAGQTTSPTFSWSAVVGANHYYLFLLDTTTNQLVPADTTPVSISAVTFSATGLTSGHSYAWYVAAVSDNGAAYFWSGPASFSVT